MDVIRDLAAAPRTQPPSVTRLQAVIAEITGDGATVLLEGDSNPLEGIKWLSHVWPRHGQTVWCDRFGRNLLITGSPLGPDRVRAHRTTDQTLAATGTWYTVTLNAESDKLDGAADGGIAIHSTSTNPSRVYATVTGDYDIGAQAAFAASATGNGRLMIRKNAAGSSSGGTALTPNSIGVGFINISYPVAQASFRAPLVAGDYLEMFVQQSAAANHTIAGGYAHTFLELRGLVAA